MEIPAAEPAPTNDMSIELKEINQIDLMGQALEGLVQKIEILAKKEIENAKKFEKQELIIKNLSQENELLKQENQKLEELLNNYMKNFQCFFAKLDESLEKQKIDSALEIEQSINDLRQKITNLELEKIDLETKVSTEDQEKLELSQKVEVMSQDIEKLNSFISKGFEDFMHHSQETKSKAKTPRLKKETSRQSRKDSTDEKPKASPIRTRHRQARKTGPIEELKEINEYENNDEDDFEVDGSEGSLDEDEEEFSYTPKKGKRKAGSGNKKGPGKKVKKNESKDAVTQNRNMIQYHLFV